MKLSGVVVLCVGVAIGTVLAGNTDISDIMERIFFTALGALTVMYLP